jgi:integrase
MVLYTSIFGDLLNQFISFKRSLGYKFVDAEGIYSRLDRFLHEFGADKICITKELACEWSKKRPNESDSTCYRRVLYLIQFSQFLNDNGFPSYIPRLPVAYKSTFTPYIFTKEETERIFNAADSLKVRNSMDTHGIVMPAILRLLYGTGLRISEALSLCVGDVDLNQMFLVVRQSKNGKERMIPFTASLAAALKQYRSCVPTASLADNSFFIRRNGQKCSSRNVYEWFRKILWEAGISHGGRAIGPCLHSFRHTFSVHTLAAMADAGLDLYYSLPILSAYLGHLSLEATEKYVRMTSERYPGILSDVQDICGFIFPEVDYE